MSKIEIKKYDKHIVSKILDEETPDFSIINGRRAYYSERKQVEQINEFKVEIYTRDHPPPHIHLTCKSKGINVSFDIETGDVYKIKSGKLKSQQIKDFKDYWCHNKENLLEEWNNIQNSQKIR
jgi:hypothetical protein